MKKIVKILGLILIVVFLNTGVSHSVFSDYEILQDNKISVAFFPVEVDFRIMDDNKTVGFEARNIGSFTKLYYEIFYRSTSGERQITGKLNLNGETTFSKENLLLGSCSGESCVYDEGVAKINLRLELTKKDETIEVFEKEIRL